MMRSDSRLRNMEVRSKMLLLVFQIVIAWCGAMHIDVRFPNEIDKEVQGTVRNLIHTGIYSHMHLDTAQVQVVTPLKVTREGDLLSRDLDHSHEHGHARSRRDLHGRDHELDHSLHYNISVDGKELRLDLRPSVTFITPAMVVERHTARGRTRQRPRETSTACHYTGSVRGQPHSSVALSACDGLAGMLRTEQGEYWIEPSKQALSNSSQGRAHVIFKRTAVDKAEAWHRAKRAVNSSKNTNSSYKRNNNRMTERYSRRMNSRRNRDSKELLDKKRREYIEARRKELEELRKNPTAWRRHKLKQRIEQRRMQSNSISSSLSKESLETLNKTRGRQNEQRPRRLRPRRRRRRVKNCATKQPPYQWREKNKKKVKDQKYRNNKNRRRFPRHHQLSEREEYEANRVARSVSKPRHVEVLLVADKSMTDFHDKEILETYLLTIMNMVSSLYMDPSIGNYIKVVVVKIILVEDTDATGGNLEVSTNADSTLSSFCRWQQELNPDDDEHPHHHDVAILVTRKDICSLQDTPCSTLGVAHVAGMCKPDISCSVNEDNGITLAHTITHELGHNFGLYHDTEKIGCHRREGSTLHIMTPIFESDTVQVAWSRCSKRDVTNFLDAGLGECLDDRPHQEEYVYPEVQAGVTFDVATQCHLEFGAEAKPCEDFPILCKHLWCVVNDTCKTALHPAAPGTKCGEDMWCQNQQCVYREPVPQPRDGGWGGWSAWSECSRSCGAGVSTQSRECNNPEPINNGKYCIGERSRYKVCNTDPCPIGEPNFREVQCGKFANSTYNNEVIAEWVPYFNQDKPCELQCVPRDRNGDDEWPGGFVTDGTPCRQTDGARDLCIAGVCHKVGCDWIVDSEAEEDACGVCGGDGSACKTVHGIFSKGTTKQTGFSEVAVIPAGSKNVKIEEKVNPGNYLSIGSAKTRKFYLNGARNQTLTEYFVAGSHAIYERDRDWEKVRIPGPIAEDIKVYQRIFRGRHRNPGVTYQYTVDKQRVPAATATRRYRLTEWSACSVTCGAGYTRRHLQCVDDRDRVVEESQCYHIEAPRHEALMAQCRQVPCPLPPVPPTPPSHWWVGAWNRCSRLCRMPGEEPTKQRSVYCVDKSSNKVIEDSACDAATRPVSTIKCAEVPPC